MSRDLVALFLPNLAGGGAERSMVTLANGIAERGFRVHLVLAKKQGVYFDEVSDKVEVIFLNAPRTILSFPHLIRYLQRHRPAALISALENANLVAIWSKLLTGLPRRLIVTERSLSTLLFHSHPRLELRILPFLTSLFYRYADQIVAVSKGVEEHLRAKGVPADKIAVVYNPIDLNRIVSLAKDPILHPWFSQAKLPIILSVGRLSFEKNFVLLLQALRALIERVEARLLILGEGEDRPILERKVRALGLEGKVDMPGFDPNPFKYMKRAAVFVLPSRFEGLPGVLIQAAALSVPIVATDCPGGSKEILEDGKWGALVPLEDPIAMAKAIERGLRGELPDPSPRAQDFAAEKVVEQYLTLLGV